MVAGSAVRWFAPGFADREPAVAGTLLTSLSDTDRESYALACEALASFAGGTELMSRAPWVLPKPDKPFPAGDARLVSTTLGWRLVNPAMPAEWTVSLGEATEQLRELKKVTRAEQDEFALRSHQAAAAAWDGGFYDDLMVPVPGVSLARDESIRPDTTLEKLAALKPVFRAGGTVTTGNASPLNDGASAVADSAAEAVARIPDGIDFGTLTTLVDVPLTDGARKATS
jgi:acetyl-CoA acetyltransferase